LVSSRGKSRPPVVPSKLIGHAMRGPIELVEMSQSSEDSSHRVTHASDTGRLVRGWRKPFRILADKAWAMVTTLRNRAARSTPAATGHRATQGILAPWRLAHHLCIRVDATLHATPVRCLSSVTWFACAPSPSWRRGPPCKRRKGTSSHTTDRGSFVRSASSFLVTSFPYPGPLDRKPFAIATIGADEPGC